jgi:succinate dehydrogenase/fumarate reductase flavoprotein subunit
MAGTSSSWGGDGMSDLIKLETDVLVVGGGFAGCFAAVKAREAGAR